MYLWFLATILAPYMAFAEPTHSLLVVGEPLTVLSQPEVGSRVLTKLKPNDQVPIFDSTVGRYKKVSVMLNGMAFDGYIDAKKIRKSQIIISKTTNDKQGLYRGKYRLGLALVVSQLNQGQSEFEMSDGTTYENSSFKSTHYFFSAFTDLNLKTQWGLRLHAGLRATKFKGTTDQKDAVIASPKSIIRSQNLLALGATIKRYPTINSVWWWGVGGELAFGSDVTVKISGVTVPTQEKDRPFFAIGFLALGGEISTPFKKFYFVPDVRLGLIGTTSPMTTLAESFLGVAYVF
jgi:hypothetical protein